MPHFDFCFLGYVEYSYPPILTQSNVSGIIRDELAVLEV